MSKGLYSPTMTHVEFTVKKPIILLVGLLLVYPVFAAPKNIDTAVSDSTAKLASSLKDGTRIAVLNCKSRSAALSEYVIQEMVFSFVNAGKFIVVEREDISLLKGELQFQLSGDVSDESAQSIGKMLGAQVIVTCSVDDANFLRTKAIEVETARLLAVSSEEILPNELFENLLNTIGDRRLITVQNVNQLMEAIGSDRVITLKRGTYDLSEGWRIKNRYVTWVDEYDGPIPVIKAVSNLSFIGEDGVTLVIRPAYGWVFSFDTCSDVTISNVTLGHTVPGYCLGGVLRFKNCENVEVRNCDLYGSGTYGVELERSFNFSMENSIIRECTYGLAVITRSSNVAFRNTVFKDTGEYDLVSVTGSDEVFFEGCEFSGNNGSVLFSVDKSTEPVTLTECSFIENAVDRFADGEERLRIQDPTFRDNDFELPSRYSLPKR